MKILRLVWLLPTSTAAFCVPYQSVHRQTSLGVGPEDEECGDEEECEIDWDSMPGFGDDDTEDESTSQVQDFSRSRLRLEMQWQANKDAEDCDLEAIQTCGTEVCMKCQGKGWNDCRFCHGTAVLKNSNEASFRPCPVCRDGVEPCSACAGTGLVAHFTTLNQGLEELHQP